MSCRFRVILTEKIETENLAMPPHIDARFSRFVDCLCKTKVPIKAYTFWYAILAKVYFCFRNFLAVYANTRPRHNTYKFLHTECYHSTFHFNVYLLVYTLLVEILNAIKCLRLYNPIQFSQKEARYIVYLSSNWRAGNARYQNLIVHAWSDIVICWATSHLIRGLLHVLSM